MFCAAPTSFAFGMGRQNRTRGDSAAPLAGRDLRSTPQAKSTCRETTRLRFAANKKRATFGDRFRHQADLTVICSIELVGPESLSGAQACYSTGSASQREAGRATLSPPVSMDARLSLKHKAAHPFTIVIP